MEFYSISERAVAVTIKLNNRYNLKIVQVYAPTLSHSDKAREGFYDVHLAHLWGILMAE